MARRGPRTKLKVKLEQNGELGQKEPFFPGLTQRERKGGRKSTKILSTIYGASLVDFVGPRIKVHRIDEGYVWVLKTLDFTVDPSEEFGKSKVSNLGSVHEAS